MSFGVLLIADLSLPAISGRPKPTVPAISRNLTP
jgi:hypothetical protein